LKFFSSATKLSNRWYAKLELLNKVINALEMFMPLISVDAMLKTIAEQQTQIQELKEQIAQLHFMLEKQNAMSLTQELLELVKKYPEKLDNPIIGSIDLH
jgi:hypothetical protein